LLELEAGDEVLLVGTEAVLQRDGVDHLPICARGVSRQRGPDRRLEDEWSDGVTGEKLRTHDGGSRADTVVSIAGREREGEARRHEGTPVSVGDEGLLVAEAEISQSSDAATVIGGDDRARHRCLD